MESDLEEIHQGIYLQLTDLPNNNILGQINDS